MYFVNALHSSCIKREENIDRFHVSDDLDNDDNDVKKGIYSIQSHELHEDRINLRVACNLFKDFIALPDEIMNYMEKHFHLNNYIIEVDSDDDGETDEENYILIHFPTEFQN